MYDLTIPHRIRKLREDAGMAGYELAKKADISPSYLSLIENGQKLPSEEVAVRLAEALRDDVELYRAWVETADGTDLDARVGRLQKMQRMLSSPGKMLHRRGRARMREAPGIVEDSSDEAPTQLFVRAGAAPKGVQFDEMMQMRQPLSLDEEPERYAEPGTWNVPLLPEGADPRRVLRGSERVEETIAIDAGLLEDDQDPGNLFAYRVTARGNERVKNLVLPGDVLVFDADPQGVDPAAIYAVRVRSKIVLSRIVYSEPNLLLMASDPYKEPLQVEVGDEDGLFRMLVGVVVAGVRSWPKPRRAEQRALQPSLGRSGRLEEGSIVRDCEWKDNYGWRPVQRAEDLDYLDEHPGATVRFPLIRDGVVKYVLEMDADQWREALGSYYEGSSWRRNGYIVAITKRVRGEYTEEFQERWAAFIRRGQV